MAKTTVASKTQPAAKRAAVKLEVRLKKHAPAVTPARGKGEPVVYAAGLLKPMTSKQTEAALKRAGILTPSGNLSKSYQ